MTTAIAISILSLAVSLSTLYFVHLRRPQVSSRIGPEILIYYADHELGGSVGFYVPITFINSSARTGSVVNVAISISRADSSEQQHFMLWRNFAKLDVDKDQWIYSESAHALAVSGNSAINRMVWFMWFAPSQPKLLLTRGSYRLRMHFWEMKGKIPKTVEYSFFIGDNESAALELFFREKLSRTISIALDKELEVNRAMTSAEAKKLLGTAA